MDGDRPMFWQETSWKICENTATNFLDASRKLFFSSLNKNRKNPRGEIAEDSASLDLRSSLVPAKIFSFKFDKRFAGTTRKLEKTLRILCEEVDLDQFTSMRDNELLRAIPDYHDSFIGLVVIRFAFAEINGARAARY